MPEILTSTIHDDRVHLLAGPGAVLDQATAQVLDAAIEVATARAYREGEAAGRAAAIDAADRAAAAVVAAFDAVRAEIRSQLDAATDHNLRFAADVAAAVLGRTPPDDALAVLGRIRDAIGALDDPGLQVRMHPADHAAIVSSPAASDLDLVADPSVARGDARIVGASCGAELTRDAMAAAAVRLLHEERT